MKVKSCLIIFVIFISFINAKRTYNAIPEYGKFHFKQFKCEPTKLCLETIAYSNYTCYAKSWSRSISTINGYMLFKRPISKGYIQAELFYKYGTIYRSVMKLPQFELCNILTLSKKNILLKQIFVAAMAAAPGFIHPCPYEVLEAYNITFPSHVMFSIFPQGDYKAVMNFTLEEDGPLMSTITAIGTAITSVKESFG